MAAPSDSAPAPAISGASSAKPVKLASTAGSGAETQINSQPTPQSPDVVNPPSGYVLNPRWNAGSTPDTPKYILPSNIPVVQRGYQQAQDAWDVGAYKARSFLTQNMGRQATILTQHVNAAPTNPTNPYAAGSPSSRPVFNPFL